MSRLTFLLSIIAFMLPAVHAQTTAAPWGQCELAVLSLFHVVEEVYAADPFYWDPCVQVKDLTGQVQRNAWPDRFALNSTTVSQNTHYAERTRSDYRTLVQRLVPMPPYHFVRSCPHIYRRLKPLCSRVFDVPPNLRLNFNPPC